MRRWLLGDDALKARRSLVHQLVLGCVSLIALGQASCTGSAAPEPPTMPVEVPHEAIVFSSKRTDDAELWLMKGDGTGPRQLTDNSIDDIDPAWSPNGGLVVYASGNGSEYDLMILNLRTRRARRITWRPGMETSPSWSPDGSTIVFAADARRGRFAFSDDLFMIDVATRKIRRLTDGPENEADPDWSPDGTSIVFSSDGCPRSAHGCNERPQNASGLLVLGSEGSVRSIVPGRGRHPTWSPDGSRIAFDDGSRVWVYSLSESRVVPLAFSAVAGESIVEPSWSPDGKWLLIVSNRDGPPGNDEIYLVSLDGRRMVRLTRSPESDGHAEWGPATAVD